ncbi:uncharacterized protein EI90DRAFT_2881729, partial [Cantharellus anzutake]|uniref:uncharacterized protein n=1 Tax=Cantharellus anzutake TaxID=1750568 RepID=UPI001904FE73
KYIIFVHGDLGTLEKIETILQSRCIEDDVLERMHYLLPIPGLFHVRMACIDAINRIHVVGHDLRNDPNSLYKKLAHLFPNDIAKLNKSVPPFHMMNDGIMFITRSTILDAWTENIGGDLQNYAESKPDWGDIERRAKIIVSEYFETNTISSDQRRNRQCDERWMNQVLFNRDSMYYRILVHAMNHGMVDIIINVLSFWVPVFQACGKYKYAKHLSKFLFQLNQLPEPLKEAVMRCWLCCPSGKEGTFRAVDWLVELMNLYTKVVYGGSGSGKTINYVISQSSIINAYRQCIEDVESDFHIPEKTLHHAAPDIQSRLDGLRKSLRELRPHRYERGRKAPYEIVD